MSLDLFHPAVSTWFEQRFGEPTEAQRQAWPSIRSGRHTLVAAPTGSGKTLSAFMAAIDDLVRLGLEGQLEDELHVLYISPLKALSNDIERNLEEPLEGVKAALKEMGLPEVPIRRSLRTGDTPARERARALKRPPHIFVTTPESLYILLTTERGRRMLSTARSVIVDEIHAMVGDKRGSHLALTLERLNHLCEGRLVRIGLSATQKPIEDVAHFLAGAQGGSPDDATPCTIVNLGHQRRMELSVEVPASPLEAVMSAEVWTEIYDRLAYLISQHKTTLIFTNTRRLAERLTAKLAERVGAEHITSHHGSLSKEHRHSAEQRLKTGNLKALVATASLELGIDIGDVDLVCQMGSTRSIAALLQRIGRSGHSVGGMPKGRVFPLSRDELIECAALMDAIRRGELDRLILPMAPLDILAQQIVAAVATDEWGEDDLFNTLRQAWPYRQLKRKDFDDVVQMLSEGFSTRRGRRGAYLHHDAVGGRLRGRRGARLVAITSGGAIPELADYQVVLDSSEIRVGTLNEDFAIESLPGDIFQLGNTSWQIVRVEPGKVRVRDAAGQPPTLPFWLGEAPARTTELSAAVSRLREEVSQRVGPAEIIGEDGPEYHAGRDRAIAWLVDEVGVARAGAEQIVDYLAVSKAALGAMPTQDTLVLERFFDESGGMQLVLHSPFGSRLNRAWGLSLRKRFCRSFNFELQAAATEEAIILSLGPTHSFPLEEVFQFLRSTTVRDILVQAMLDAPMFPTRWRWNANRSLAVPRFRSGKKVAPQLQRFQADDLVSVVFPDQLACLENIAGDREIPEHPLVQQTITDCLEEAMDIDALEALLRDIEGGKKTLLGRDLREPSPLSQEIINARPYAFLDDAPLEERRTQAVYSRRFLDPKSAAELGSLDQSAIDRVKAEAWPQVRDADELHDALMLAGYLTEAEGLGRSRPPAPDDELGWGDDGWWASWQPLMTTLTAGRRATRVQISGGEGDGPLALWVAAERLPEVLAIHPDAQTEPAVQVPRRYAATQWDEHRGRIELVRSRLETVGPTTSSALGKSLGLSTASIDAALAALEAEGFAMRGRFCPGATGEEWCERRLLARIHRYTIQRLRREIKPVSPQDFTRFLFEWHHLSEGEAAEGPDGLAMILEQLEGFDAPAAAWEGEILPARVKKYDPSWLDGLCLSGRIAWLRPLRSSDAGRAGKLSGPVRSTPIAIVGRDNLAQWDWGPGVSGDLALSHGAGTVLAYLSEHGASFFHELSRGVQLLESQLEDALGELVSAGLITSDSFTGLRGLLVPSNQRPSKVGRGSRRRRSAYASIGLQNAGRWSLVHKAKSLNVDEPPPDEPLAEEGLFEIARTLLDRYGVVFRKILERESCLPPWRDLLRVLRRMEARGEIRGGRFVTSFAGEQFALSEAVGKLRAVRRKPKEGELISLSGADPLNLQGIMTPGRRLAAITPNRILYRDGEPVAVLEAKEVRFLVDIPPQEQWELEKALVRKKIPPRLRGYLRSN